MCIQRTLGCLKLMKSFPVFNIILSLFSPERGSRYFVHSVPQKLCKPTEICVHDFVLMTKHVVIKGCMIYATVNLIQDH